MPDKGCVYLSQQPPQQSRRVDIADQHTVHTGHHRSQQDGPGSYTRSNNQPTRSEHTDQHAATAHCKTARDEVSHSNSATDKNLTTSGVHTMKNASTRITMPASKFGMIFQDGRGHTACLHNMHLRL